MSVILDPENPINIGHIEIQDDVDHNIRIVTENPQDGSAGSGHDDMHQTKKKKTRRGKPKRGRGNTSSTPYIKPSWQQRQNTRKKKRTKVLKPGQALAPYNSNQFLIEDHDHGYIKEIEERLKNRIERLKTHPEQARTRDSSFSVDSDMDYYSTPEDEEEFLTREFSNTYQDVRTERLNTMSREELLQECVQMENRLEVLTKCISKDDPKDDSVVSVDITTLPDFQMQVMKLMNENDALRRENERLRTKGRPRRKRQSGSVSSSSSSLTSSIDSESDSSSNSSSDSDRNEEQPNTSVTTNNDELKMESGVKED